MRLAAFIAAAVLVSAAPVLAADPLTPDQKAAVEQVIRDTLQHHPEIVLEALEAAERQHEAEAREDSKKAIAAANADLYADPSSPAGGNVKGDVTIVEFFDYRCPYCKAIEPSLETLIKADGNLRIVYKEFPILGPASVYAARVALASVAQGKYDAFHNAMMAVKGPIDDDAVRHTAGSVGLDMAKIESGVDGEDIDRVIAANYKLARALDVDGTPAFVIGDRMLPGVESVETLKAAIAAVRKGG
jgi:protein-disulfide isomerase